jgi:hypothetical protein
MTVLPAPNVRHPLRLTGSAFHQMSMGGASAHPHDPHLMLGALSITNACLPPDPARPGHRTRAPVVNRPKVKQATDHHGRVPPCSGPSKAQAAARRSGLRGAPISTRRRTSHLFARSCDRFHRRAVLLHRSKDFRNAGAAPRTVKTRRSRPQRGPPKRIWSLTDPGQKHRFNAFSRRLKRRPLGARKFWPGICSTTRTGFT